MFIDTSAVVLEVMIYMEMMEFLSQWMIYHCQEERHWSICQELMELISWWFNIPYVSCHFFHVVFLNLSPPFLISYCFLLQVRERWHKAAAVLQNISVCMEKFKIILKRNF